MKPKLYQKVKLKDGRVGYIIEDFQGEKYLFDCVYKESPHGKEYNDCKQSDITEDDILAVYDEESNKDSGKFYLRDRPLTDEETREDYISAIGIEKVLALEKELGHKVR